MIFGSKVLNCPSAHGIIDVSMADRTFIKEVIVVKASLQLKNGIYQAVISYKDENGKFKTKWQSTGLKEGTGKRRLEEKCKQILAEFEEEYNRKLYSTPKSLPAPVMKCKFTDFMDRWLNTIKLTIAHSTYIGYAKNIRKIKKYFTNGIMLDELQPIHIQEFYNQLYEEGLSGNTVKHIHANIHKALKYAVKNNFIQSNPSDKVELRKIEKFTANFYNKDELAKLFETFRNDRMELCVYIAAYYGLRRSEVLGLKWDAIDFEKKTISIQHKVINDYGDGKEHLIFEDNLKNASSHRTLPLIPHIEKLLLEEKEKQEHYMNLLKGGYNRKYIDYVCRDNLGNMITPNFVTDHFRYMIKTYSLKKLRFHDLRHSCASLLLANGVSMKEIQEWLGHSTYNVTANFYSHLEYSSKLASADVISTVLG